MRGKIFSLFLVFFLPLASGYWLLAASTEGRSSLFHQAAKGQKPIAKSINK